MMIMLYYSSLCSRGYSKRPIIDPATVQLQNNCTVVGSYAHRLLYSANNRCTIMYIIIGERAKRARHSQVCSIENRGYIYIYCIVRAKFVLITRKEGGA